MTYERRNERFQRTLSKLTSIAKDDGVITSKEAEILNTVKITVDQYETAVEKAAEDGIITSDEKLQLEKIEDNLLAKTFEMIERDEQLNTDSRELVETLFETLMNIL